MSSNNSGSTAYPSHVTVPTDSSPIIIQSGVELRSGGFLLAAGFVSYDDVVSLHFYSSFVNGTGGTELSIRFLGRAEVKVSSATYFFISGARRRRIVAAYLFLAHCTFASRYAARLRDLRDNGFLECDGVRIYANGDVTRRGTTVNLKSAQRSGFLLMGVSRGFGKWVRPDEVLIGLDGVGPLATKISFVLTWDKDVLSALITQIANAP